MPKRGPCGHCGTNCTPLWRNGPKEMPVLCNACGSRWRLCGNLHNYVPHNGARTRPRARSHMKKKPKKNNTIITRNISKTRNGLRGRTENNIIESSSADPYYYYYTSTDDSEFEVSNNSSISSDSATSYCKISTRSTTSQIPGRDKSRLLISTESDNNDGGHCSRARTPVSVSAVEKLQKDLYNIMVRLGSSFKSPDEDLLLYTLNYNNQLDHHEIGLGGVLLQPPPSPAKGPFTVCNIAAPMASSRLKTEASGEASDLNH